MNQKLQFCPFCSKTIKDPETCFAYSQWGDIKIQCGNCMAEGPWATSKAEAIEKWNYRKPQAKETGFYVFKWGETK